MSSRVLALAEPPKGFRIDPRFYARMAGQECAQAPQAESELPDDQPDPLEESFARGLAEGAARAEAETNRRLAEAEARFTKLLGAIERFQKTDARALSDALRQTVLGLCEETIRPLALDPEDLARRAERAASMLVRARDERKLRLNPEDARLVEPLLSPGLTIIPDSSIERGSLCIDTPDGGIEDGPAIWMQALREAFGAC